LIVHKKEMKGRRTKTLATLAILVSTFPTMMVRCFSSAGVVVNTKATMRVREAAFQWLQKKGVHSTTSLPMIHISKEGVKTASTLPEIPKNAHRMVLMRHGESEFNTANVFTGWCDVALTQRGENQFINKLFDLRLYQIAGESVGGFGHI
jgi:hypothetical protein